MNSKFELLSEKRALIEGIVESVYQVKSSVIICLPEPINEVLEAIKFSSLEKRSCRFLIIGNFQDKKIENIYNELMSMKRVQLRSLTAPVEFYSLNRDAEEIILCPSIVNEDETIGFKTSLESYINLYAKSIGPILLANSRPLK